ncbi:MAG: hypothetical protein WBG90_07130 [Saonia sp.]
MRYWTPEYRKPDTISPKTKKKEKRRKTRNQIPKPKSQIPEAGNDTTAY